MDVFEMSFCNTTLERLPTRDWNLAFGVLLAIVSVLAVIENGFILLLFYKYQKLRTASNKILASVAIADWLTGLTVGPLYSAQLLSEPLNNNCDVHLIRRVFGVIIMGASLTSIALMTIDRSRHLTKLKGYTMQNKWLYGGLVICWLFPLGAALVGTISDGVHSAIVATCGVSLIVVILACYAMVIMALKRHRRSTLDKKNSVYMNNERKAAKTVIIIITCFLLMLLPLFIEKGLFSFKVLTDDTPGASQAHMFTILLYISNSCVNPIIYTSRLPAMRKFTMVFFRMDDRKGARNQSAGAMTGSSSTLIDKGNVLYTKV